MAESEITAEVSEGDILIVTSEVNFQLDMPGADPATLCMFQSAIESGDSAVVELVLSDKHWTINTIKSRIWDSSTITRFYMEKANGTVCFYAVFYSKYGKDVFGKFSYCEMKITNLGPEKAK